MSYDQSICLSDMNDDENAPFVIEGDSSISKEIEDDVIEFDDHEPGSDPCVATCCCIMIPCGLCYSCHFVEVMRYIS